MKIKTTHDLIFDLIGKVIKLVPPDREKMINNELNKITHGSSMTIARELFQKTILSLAPEDFRRELATRKAEQINDAFSQAVFRLVLPKGF